MSDRWRVPLFRPTIGTVEEEAVLRVLRSGWLTTGPETAAFEQEVADVVHAPYAVATSSGTHAMQLALMAHDIGGGHEVITSPITFAATVAAICDVGATPVLADIDPINGNLCPEGAARAITERTRAILPIHLAGHPADHEALGKLSRQHDLVIIEDAAHALETVALREGLPVDAACFSFYASKNMTTAEGGMIVTHNKAVADRARDLRCHGMTRAIADRHGSASPWSYDITHRGIKANMSDLAAALGRAQLPQVMGWYERRRQIAGIYIEQLSNLAALSMPNGLNDPTHAWHLFTVRIAHDLRDRVLAHMTESGIGCSVHFQPVFALTAYKSLFPNGAEQMPNATSWAATTLSLPLFPTMSDEEAHLVIDTLRAALETAGGNQ